MAGKRCRSRANVIAAATAAALAALAIVALRRRRRRPTLDEALRYVGNSVYKGGRKGPNQYKGGDKSSSGQNFTAWYSELCAPLRDRPDVHALEIGVFFGKSLAMWSDYLRPDATLHGVDISLANFNSPDGRSFLIDQGAFTRGTLVLHECDSWSAEFDSAMSALPALDLVVDDGDHRAASQWRCFCVCFPKLKPGALYIVEDVEDPVAFFARERFGSIAAAVADGEAYWRSEAQRQRESTVAAAEAAQADAHAKLQDAVTRLERRVAGDGVSGNIPQALREALEAKRRQLAATPARLDAAARAAAKAAAEADVALRRELSAMTASVEVRRRAVAIWRAHEN